MAAEVNPDPPGLSEVGKDIGVEVIPRGAGDYITMVRAKTGRWVQRPGTHQEWVLFSVLTGLYRDADQLGGSPAQAVAEERSELLTAVGKVRLRHLSKLSNPAAQRAVDEALAAVEGMISGDRL